MDYRSIIETTGQYLDMAGVAVTVIGALVSVPLAIQAANKRSPVMSPSGTTSVYRAYRQLLGRSILLGLELLVAADIIRTVAVTPSLTSVGVLAGIVLIRTFLSFSLELEISGRWPWQKEPREPQLQVTGSSGEPARQSSPATSAGSSSARPAPGRPSGPDAT